MILRGKIVKIADTRRILNFNDYLWYDLKGKSCQNCGYPRVIYENCSEINSRTIADQGRVWCMDGRLL